MFTAQAFEEYRGITDAEIYGQAVAEFLAACGAMKSASDQFALVVAGAIDGPERRRDMASAALACQEAQGERTASAARLQQVMLGGGIRMTAATAGR